MSTTPPDRIAGVVLAVAGLALALGTYLSSGFGDGSSFVIFLGGVICACSVATALRARPPAGDTVAESEPSRAESRLPLEPRHAVPLAMWIGLVGYAALLHVLAFLPATILYGTYHLWMVFKFGWPKALLVATAVAVPNYLLFVRFLEIPFT